LDIRIEYGVIYFCARNGIPGIVRLAYPFFECRIAADLCGNSWLNGDLEYNGY